MAETVPAEPVLFQTRFRRWSRRVRARLALGLVLTGAAAGLAAGAGASALAWHARKDALRPLSALGGVLGAAAGLAVARRRRWDQVDVALYLDGKLGSHETIATALELLGGGAATPAASVVLAQANEALEKATPGRVRPPVFRPWHLGVPAAAGLIAYVSWIPLPPPPAPPPAPPGVEKVQLADVQGLEKVIRLEELDGRDDAQRERLKKVAEDAKRLREKLRSGVEKREAQADIARLRDAITAEKLSLGDGERRQGLESALGKMADNPAMRDAQKALGDRDLVRFDEEMEKLANKLEAHDRERAKKTLEEAAEAAKKAGAPDVAKALEEQKRLMEERGKRADALRELAKALGEGLTQEQREALEDFGQSGSDKDAQKLAEKLNEALNGLSEQQRKQLAENLKKQLAQQLDQGQGSMPPSKQRLKELAKELDTPEGQERLEEMLEQMGKGAPNGEEAQRQQGLGDAEKGLGETEGQLGGMPMPMPMAGGGDGQQGKGQKGGGKPQNSGSAGHTEGGGPGDHEGQTGVVEGDGVQARASSKVNKGKPMPGIVMGRTAGRAGETANTQGTGALGNVGAQEVSGIERSDVPEEYREQVGRYFNPK